MIKKSKEIIGEFNVIKKMIEMRQKYPDFSNELPKTYWSNQSKKIEIIEDIISHFEDDEQEIFKAYYFENKRSDDFYLSKSSFYDKLGNVSTKFCKIIDFCRIELKALGFENV